MAKTLQSVQTDELNQVSYHAFSFSRLDSFVSDPSFYSPFLHITLTERVKADISQNGLLRRKWTDALQSTTLHKPL